MLGRLDVLEVEEVFSCFIFAFQIVEDKKYGKKWNIDGAMMVLKKYNPNIATETLDFTGAPLWVQLHGMVRRLMIADNINKMAKNVGLILKMEKMPPRHHITKKKIIENNKYAHF